MVADFDFQPQPIDDNTNTLVDLKKRSKKLKKWLLGILVAATMVAATLVVTYQLLLRPVNAQSSETKSLEINSGMTPRLIAEKLFEEELIRSPVAFRIYIKLHGIENYLLAGSYDISPSQSSPEIANILHEGGEMQTFEVTFLPGSTLDQVRQVLQGAGYTVSEVNEALTADYNLPFLSDKPADADLEGYLFAETHQFEKGTPAQDVIETFLTDFNQFVIDQNLQKRYQKKGLSLFAGITLASIIEKESAGGDQRQIAQVFLLRLDRDMKLDADPTYQYAADKLDVARDINLDSPYNTRRYKGLPPGPIAIPGKESLQAVANPANGDYLFFVHGDDNRIHLAKTEAEHESNVADFCHEKCQMM